MSQFGSGWGKQGRNVAAPMPDLNPTSTNQITGTAALNMNPATTQANTDDLDNIVKSMRSATGAVQSGAQMAANIGQISKGRKTAAKGITQDQAIAEAESFDFALKNNMIDQYDDEGNKVTNIEEGILARMDQSFEAGGVTGITAAATDIVTEQARAMVSGSEMPEDEQEIFVNAYVEKSRGSILDFYSAARERTRDDLAPGITSWLSTAPLADLRESGIRQGSGIQGLVRHLGTDQAFRGETDAVIGIIEDSITMSISQGNFDRAGLFVGMLKQHDPGLGQAAQNKFNEAYQDHNERSSRRHIEGFVSGAGGSLDPEQLSTIAQAVDGRPEFEQEIVIQLGSMRGMDSRERLQEIKRTGGPDGKPLDPRSPLSRILRQAANRLPTDEDLIQEAKVRDQENLRQADLLSQVLIHEKELPHDKYNIPSGDNEGPQESVNEGNFHKYLKHRYGTEIGNKAYSEHLKMKSASPVTKEQSQQSYMSVMGQIENADSYDDIDAASKRAHEMTKQGLLSRDDYARLKRETENGTRLLEVKQDADFEEFLKDFETLIVAKARVKNPKDFERVGDRLILEHAGKGQLSPEMLANLNSAQRMAKKEWLSWFNGSAQESYRDGDATKYRPMTDGEGNEVLVKDLIGDQYQNQRKMQLSRMRQRYGLEGSLDFSKSQNVAESIITGTVE